MDEGEHEVDTSAEFDQSEGFDQPELRTGSPRVDGVLDDLAGLDDLPVAEHLAVFERAHEALREALEAPDN
ncbi:MAG: hypothetical protein QM714_04730 [Nocardioides sp.]|uniref:hypothetical protein n=1 Tax=Nocardioides sp. TaxID=35761 RepID=UPI0039E61FA7